MTAGEIAAIERSHTGARPVIDSGPLIVIEIAGRREFIDGNNRANRIIAGQLPGTHPVIVVTVIPAVDGWPPRAAWNAELARI